jgi:tRNA splicing ligase
MHMLGFASLTSTAFNLSTGNTLTLVFNASGLFTAANA